MQPSTSYKYVMNAFNFVRRDILFEAVAYPNCLSQIYCLLSRSTYDEPSFLHFREFWTTSAEGDPKRNRPLIESPPEYSISAKCEMDSPVGEDISRPLIEKVAPIIKMSIKTKRIVLK